MSTVRLATRTKFSYSEEGTCLCVRTHVCPALRVYAQVTTSSTSGNRAGGGGGTHDNACHGHWQFMYVPFRKAGTYLYAGLPPVRTAFHKDDGSRYWTSSPLLCTPNQICHGCFIGHPGQPHVANLAGMTSEGGKGGQEICVYLVFSEDEP